MDDREEQVWRRVFARPEDRGAPELGPLVGWSAESAAVYRQLLGNSTKHRELLRKLYEGEQATLACLRGIGVLSGGREAASPLPPVREPAERALIKCYHRTRRAMVEYTARSAGTEFGGLFRSLADRAQAQCLLLAQLLGSL